MNKMSLFLMMILLIVFSSCKKKQEEAKQEDYYTCSMDPQIRQNKPGICPICKMELTKVSGKEHSSGIKLSEEQIELANIKTEKVDSGYIGQGKVLNGQVVVNENRQAEISSRIGGRIERLYFKDLGETIHKGQVIYEIYSEELLSVQREYLLLLKKEKQLKNFGIDYNQLIDASKNKLKLWGLTDKQIKTLKDKDEVRISFPILSTETGTITEINIKEGDYVKEGQGIFKLADFSIVWVMTQIYVNEVYEISEGKEVFININGFPNKIFKGKVTFVNPQLQEQTKVIFVRIEVPNSNLLLKPGMQASVTLNENRHKALLVSTSAVLLDSQGASAWVKNREGAYENKMVYVGVSYNGKTEVLHGLSHGEDVVVSGAYLINSEYIFKKGTSPMAGHDMSKM